MAAPVVSAPSVVEIAAKTKLDPNAKFPDHQVTANFSFPIEETKVIEYWRSIDAFKESLRQSKQQKRKPYSFYDGPPFATGLPHYGHLLAGTIKDIVTRHAHSTGHHVERRFGWDCHGLPVEHEIDKKLGITGKQDVMDMGIAKYNEECRSIVMRYQGEWREIVERMGRWIDFDGGYKTLNTTFMESEWWAFKTLFEKGLVYKGLRVMPYSNGCTTPLSNFEAGSDYREVSDPAVTVSFPLKHDPKASLLAWTTTPWTLPSNIGLCVHPDFNYVRIKDEESGNEYYLHENLLTTLYKDPKKAKFTKLATVKGKEMVGWTYEPLFDYFYEEFKDTGFRVLSDTYVTADAGTGIVHQAPAFGDDDHRVAIAHGVIRKDQAPPCPVDESGRFTSQVKDYEGVNVKEADKQIQKDLKKTGRLIVQSTIRHQYPFCWRSGTPLIYKAIPAWFIRVEPAIEKLLANNKATRWVPPSIGEGRFGGWLANARDWNVSRNRYWGTPIPLWASEDWEEIVCIGSVAELEELSGVSGITDLHRENVDGITIPSKKGKGNLKRVEEVFDCWFESGSMPFAQAHYPFENKKEFEESFPAQFVAEGIDQTRGWFYTLLILSTHLFESAPWQNVIVNGLVMAADGKKMSKSLKNFPDPSLVINKHGADAIRLYLVNSPAVRAENLRFKEEGVKEIVSSAFLPWLNSFRFFLGQVALLKKEKNIDFMFDPKAKKSDNTMDRWILAQCHGLIGFVKQEMDAYHLYTVVPRLLDTIGDLTNWYIRFNRRRLKGDNGPEDAVVALNALFETLFTLCRTMSSFTPFLTENIYQGLRPFIPTDAERTAGEDLRSVHFLSFPEVRQDYLDPVIQRQFSAFKAVVELARQVREAHSLPVRVPLNELVVFHSDAQYLEDIKALSTYVEEELNVRRITLTSDESKWGVRFSVTADWPVLGRKLRKEMGKVKAAFPSVTSDQAKEFMSTGKIQIAGVDLEAGDLRVIRSVDLASVVAPEDGVAKYEADTDGGVIVLLDCSQRPELQNEGTARELVNRVQRLRKRAGLQATDECDAFYTFEEGLGQALKEIWDSQLAYFDRTLKRRPMELKKSEQESKNVLLSEETEIGDDRFLLSLVRL